MFPTLVGIATTIYFPTWMLWFAAIAFKPFSARVKNLWFASTVTSLFKMRLQLRVIFHNFDNQWRMFHFLININGKKWDLDWPLLKNQRKAKRCNNCALDPKKPFRIIQVWLLSTPMAHQTTYFCLVLPAHTCKFQEIEKKM